MFGKQIRRDQKGKEGVGEGEGEGKGKEGKINENQCFSIK